MTCARWCTALLLSLCVGLVVDARAAAADLSGEWALTMDPDPRGNVATVPCTVTQRGDALVVHCGDGTSQMSGRVSGRKVSFHTPPLPAGAKTGVVLSFDGEVGPSRATTLSGAWRAVFMLTSSSEVKTGKFRASRR
jgi:hypothetical protein